MAAFTLNITDPRVTQLIASVATLSSDINALTAKVNQMSGTVDTVASELATLQSGVATLQTEVTALISAFQAAQANAGLTPAQAAAFDAANAQIATLNTAMAGVLPAATPAPAAS